MLRYRQNYAEIGLRRTHPKNSPFGKGGYRGIFKISPKPLFTKEGNEHPHPVLPFGLRSTGSPGWLTNSPPVPNSALYSSHWHPSRPLCYTVLIILHTSTLPTQGGGDMGKGELPHREIPFSCIRQNHNYYFTFHLLPFPHLYCCKGSST